MRVPLSWLKDYIDIDVSGEELAEKLTSIGVSVELVEYISPEVTGVTTGHIRKIRPHPNADKLVLCDVDAGTGELLQIVTGAPNVREGHKVPVALHGANLAGGLKIKKSKLRGETSEGMLCSAKELGLDIKDLPQDQREGVMLLPEDTKPGTDLIEAFCLHDPILIVETFANRPDQLSLLGIAREVGAALGKTIRPPLVSYTETDEKVEDRLSVKIENYELCKKYSGRIIQDMPLKPSPLKVQGRLMAAGMRPINNVVDITNYVMIETGQPLHAFDYDKVSQGRIIVRSAKNGENITTLDEKKRELDSSMLVIAGPEEAVALAGVMGGLDSEISSETTNILLESASFNPASVRRTSIKLGLRSESSRRFEKGIDYHQVDFASRRAAYLMNQAGGKVLKGEAVDAVEAPQPREIKLRPERVNRILGTDLSRETMVNILKRLDFHVGGDSVLKVTVPTVRQDISMEIDLIEEIARLYGYDNIPTTTPIGVSVGVVEEETAFDERLRDLCARCNLLECITLSLYEEKKAKLYGHKLEKMMQVKNPITEDQAYMRRDAVPHLVDVVKRNISVRENILKLFEISKFYTRNDGREPLERRELTLLLTGPEMTPGVDFFTLKGILAYIFDDLNIDISYQIGEISYFHPNKTAEILADDTKVGIIGVMHPQLLMEEEIEQEIVIARLYLDELLKLTKQPHYRSISRYPSVQRDIAIVMDESIPAGNAGDIIMKKGSPLLDEAYCFDVYTGEQIPAGKKSLAFTLTFSDPEKTLTDEEVKTKIDAILEGLSEELNITLRS
ncbi:MAG: phenylalanine--tRNA ligase subunit beta [Vulcanimicrobiota bacterium]